MKKLELAIPSETNGYFYIAIDGSVHNITVWRSEDTLETLQQAIHLWECFRESGESIEGFTGGRLHAAVIQKAIDNFNLKLDCAKKKHAYEKSKLKVDKISEEKNDSKM